MNIYSVILNRVLFRILPSIGLFLLAFYFELFTSNNLVEEFNVIHGLLIGLFLFYCFDLWKHIIKAQERIQKLKLGHLEQIPKDIELPRRINFLDKRVSIDSKSIDIYHNNNMILHVNTTKTIVEIRNLFSKKYLPFKQIDFLVLEYNEYEKDTIKDIFTRSSYYDKNVWVNSVSAKLKNGNLVALFDATLEETNMEQFHENQITGEFKPKSYIHSGEKMIQLLSYYFQKKYLIISAFQNNLLPLVTAFRLPRIHCFSFCTSSAWVIMRANSSLWNSSFVCL
jgi:hypothetical protein